MNFFGSKKQTQSSHEEKRKRIKGLPSQLCRIHLHVIYRDCQRSQQVQIIISLTHSDPVNRQVTRDGRSIDKEIRELERAEKDIIMKIKQAHKKGQEVRLYGILT